MFGISIGPRPHRRDARRIAGRGLHRAEALRDALPEAREVRDVIDGAIEELRGQAQPVMDRALHRKQRRSKKPLLLLVLLAAGAAIAYFVWNRRDEEPAYLVQDPDRPDATPDASPSPDGGRATIPGSPDVSTGTIPSAAPSMPRPVVMPTGSAPAPVSAPPPTTSPNPATMPAPVNGTAPQSRYYGAAPVGHNGSRGPAAWDLPSAGASTPPGAMPR